MQHRLHIHPNPDDTSNCMLTASEHPFWQLVTAQFRLGTHTDHGPRHWRTVLRNGTMHDTQRDGSGRLTGNSTGNGKCQGVARVPVPPITVTR